MHNKGVDAVVARMNLQYKVPLRPDDIVVSRLWIEKQGIKYIFHQDLFREKDNALCFRGDITLVCLVNGRLADSEDYERAFAPFLNS
jgi:acyl-CoA thioester hydrolase